MVSANVRFWILIGIVGISGFSQGMLMPTIAIIFEHAGISSSVNGIHATALYIGILVASPFMEKPMMKMGYKPFIVLGGVLVFVSLFSFTLWDSLIFWFVLRLLIGIGDQMLHFGSQTWITTTVSEKTRGRSVALYGLSFGLGFAMGPLLTRLVEVNEALPFMLSAALSMTMWLLIFLVRNERPDIEEDSFKTVGSTRRIAKTLKIAWVAMLPGFTYGILEATLHGIFPVYGLRIGHDVGALSLIIPLFALGSVVTQLPLGALSDRLGRRKVLIAVFFTGIICFTLAGVLESSVVALFILFAVSGMAVGSTFSLGIAYMTDLLPRALLPAGNILVGVCFSLGSIIGPFLGGLFIETFPHVSLFYLIVGMLTAVLIVLLMNREKAIP
ncbi:putative MFS-type transporter YfkF [Lentibacillus sp. JNUCC-1]|uniref:MFS transporter n=1 Tax=Lentibacillus sp. JNUCC-1 TaxID=2654513 RepID=UPI0012E8B5BC|nr:MFS transporter [Lentibacillus sp. JNUCC-1]MUV37782.1 putative MFS-type transporter YfkF [Lentibacillus sp. JNUCC-1]